MSGIARVHGWFLWMPDDCQYLDCGNERVTEKICIRVWAYERICGTGFLGCHNGKSKVDNWVREPGLYELTTDQEYFYEYR